MQGNLVTVFLRHPVPITKDFYLEQVPCPTLRLKKISLSLEIVPILIVPIPILLLVLVNNSIITLPLLRPNESVAFGPAVASIFLSW